MIYGLTGGIATGKSTVSDLFRQLGAAIIDADVIAHQAVEPGSLGAQRIKDIFGAQFFSVKGELNRRLLADLIFSDEKERIKLNQLIHPLVMAEMQRQSASIRGQQEDAVIIWDIPLLYEENLTDFVQKVIVVYVPKEIQQTRLQSRNNLNQSEANARIQSQLSIETKKRLADYVIDNSGSVQQTKRQVVALWNRLT